VSQSTPNPSEIILYQTEDGRTRLQVRLKNETAWLSLNQLADLFQRDKSVISKHIKNIFGEGELRPEATVANFATVQIEGSRTISRDIECYNLDVIIAGGYRVKSSRGTQFRIWATKWPNMNSRRCNLRLANKSNLRPLRGRTICFRNHGLAPTAIHITSLRDLEHVSQN